MTKIITLLAVAILITSCYPPEPRSFHDLSSHENHKMSNLRSEWNKCLNDKMIQLDDGMIRALKLTQIVSKECELYEKTMKKIMRLELNLDIGSSYQYLADIKDTTKRNVTKAILMRRKEWNQRRRPAPAR